MDSYLSPVVYVLNECFFVNNNVGKMTLGNGENNMSWVTNAGYGDIKLSVVKHRLCEQVNPNAAQGLTLGFIYCHGQR